MLKKIIKDFRLMNYVLYCSSFIFCCVFALLYWNDSVFTFARKILPQNLSDEIVQVFLRKYVLFIFLFASILQTALFFFLRQLTEKITLARAEIKTKVDGLQAQVKTIDHHHQAEHRHHLAVKEQLVGLEKTAQKDWGEILSTHEGLTQIEKLLQAQLEKQKKIAEEMEVNHARTPFVYDKLFSSMKKMREQREELENYFNLALIFEYKTLVEGQGQISTEPGMGLIDIMSAGIAAKKEFDVQHEEMAKQIAQDFEQEKNLVQKISGRVREQNYELESVLGMLCQNSREISEQWQEFHEKSEKRHEEHLHSLQKYLAPENMTQHSLHELEQKVTEFCGEAEIFAPPLPLQTLPPEKKILSLSKSHEIHPKINGPSLT